jgi:iron(III) transport system substrate-binding protein
MKKSLAASFACLALLAFASSAEAASGKLTLYTSMLEADANHTVQAFEKANPGVAMSWTRGGSTEILNRLRAEYAAGGAQADVVLLADALSLEALKADHRLMPDPDAPVASLAKALYDPDLTYFGTKIITTGIAYNTGAPMKPASWKDLLKPEAKGRVTLPSPLYSGAASLFLAAMKAQPGFGLDYFEKLKANGAVATKANGAVLTAVAGGEKLYGIIVDYMPLREALKGAPVAFAFPAEGVSTITEPVAILSGTKNAEAAKAFVAFVLSRAGQELALEEGFYPADSNLDPPKGFPSLKGVKLLGFDGAKALKDVQSNNMAFADLFGG